MKRIFALCVALAASVLLAACSTGAPMNSGSSAALTSSASSAAPSGQSASSASSAAPSGQSASSSTSAADTKGDTVVIPLDYSAGTGYEWECAAVPEGIVEQLDRTTSSTAEDDGVTGGPLRDEFTFRAVAPGEVVLTFDLVRSWEGEPAETQVYAFTVSDSLEMTLNPYKSDFDNEPEWAQA